MFMSWFDRWNNASPKSALRSTEKIKILRYCESLGRKKERLSTRWHRSRAVGMRKKPQTLMHAVPSATCYWHRHSDACMLPQPRLQERAQLYACAINQDRPRKNQKLDDDAFLLRETMLALYMLSSWVCTSIRLSVCLLHAGIVPNG